MRRFSALVLVAVTLSACAPTCEQVCRKARECHVTDRLFQHECEESCTRQRALYDEWEDEALQEAFAAHRRCIAQATCEELEAGVCYDEALFPF